MNRRKTWIIALSGVLLAGAALGIVLWRRSAESGLALLRILPPQADLYALADFESLQRNPAVRRFLSDPPEFSVEEDYRRFVDGSGFRYQDDLRRLALARIGSNWVGAARITADRSKILQYLSNEATESSDGTEGTEGTETTEVHGTTVFVFGQVRPFRLALPARDLAIFTIGEDNTLIANTLERYTDRPAASAASELATTGELGRLSQGNALWLLGRTEQLLREGSVQPQSGLFRFGGPLLRGSKALYLTVESRLTQLEFQLENRCEDEAAALRFARMIQSLLVLLRAAPLEGADPTQGKLAVLLRDISVQQVADSVLLQWQWDAETLRAFE